MQLELLNDQGQAASKVDAPETVFGREYNEALIHQIVVAYQANARQGTRAQKDREQVHHSTKKPFKQKGTGNARQGSLRSPQMRGGGIIFGPKPITANYKINKKERIHVKKLLIAKFITSGNITVVSNLEIPAFKTQEAKKVINALALNGRIAIIHNDEISYESLKSLSNLKDVGAYSNSSFHLHEIIKYDNLVFTESSFKKFIEVLQ